jgi:hypothetical protein
MGTSISRRSPSKSLRWRAARAAIASGDSDRTAQELLSAAATDEWASMLRSDALREFATAALDAPELLDESTSPELAYRQIRSIGEAARDRALSRGDGGLMVAIGERSLATVLLRRWQSAGRQEVGTGPAVAAEFFSEAVRQLSLHLTARDLAAARPSANAVESRDFTRRVAEVCVSATAPARNLLLVRGVGAWPDAVALVFGAPQGE